MTRPTLLHPATLLLTALVLFAGCATNDRAAAFDDLRARLAERLERFDGDVGLYVRDLATGEQIAFAADTKFPTASMIKVPILCALFERIEAGELAYDQKLTYTRDRLYEGEDLLGASYETLRQKRGDKVAYIFQDPLATLHPLYRVGDQMIEAIQSHHKVSSSKARARALELFNAVRIPNAEKRLDNYPHEMSGGMRQRVGIAMAMANDPEVIIADEPTTALDVTVQAQILALLDDLRRERGLAIIFITHDFGVVAQLCDRVAVMYAGRIIEEGPTQTILDAPAHPYTKRLIACVPELGEGRRRLEAIPGLPPVVDKLPDGCAFAPRCAKATPECQRGEIHLEKGTARAVRCIHPEEAIA